MADEVIVPATTYTDEDLVYVDPLKKVVVGRVEFLPNGRAKKLPMKFDVPDVIETAVPLEKAKEKETERRRPMRERYYPWGTYRSMKRVYKLEGKIPKAESNATLDQVMEKALKEPFWDL